MRVHLEDSVAPMHFVVGGNLGSRKSIQEPDTVHVQHDAQEMNFGEIGAMACEEKDW